MKFVCSIPLLHEGVVEYSAPGEAGACPLAQQLFSFSGIKSVFITSNFITVTKESEIDWYEITGIIREFIKGFLASGEKVFISNPFSNQKQNPEKIIQTSENFSEIEDSIINALEEYVKPAVEQDGGAIHFKSFNNGVVTVSLKGSCSGCPSSTLTLKSGIENLLKQMIPSVTEVVAEAE
jgi:Fe-S cluster biogenesis protein NfuA